MRVLVTRPAREAQRWVQELEQRGIPAVPLPLIEIAPAPDVEAVQRAWADLGEYRAAMFVSGNAVERFFLLKPAHAQAWSDPAIRTRAWAPGPGTREALLRAGVPQALIDTPSLDSEQFDSQSLWQQVAGQVGAGQRVLLVRGGDAAGRSAGRDWLTAQLTRCGVEVDTVVAYSRRAPAWIPAQFELAQQGSGDGSLWLFSSSEAITHLRSLMPQQAWNQARAIATHPRIAQSASDAGFGVVCLSRPTLDDVVASIESMR